MQSYKPVQALIQSFTEKASVVWTLWTHLSFQKGKQEETEPNEQKKANKEKQQHKHTKQAPFVLNSWPNLKVTPT